MEGGTGSSNATAGGAHPLRPYFVAPSPEDFIDTLPPVSSAGRSTSSSSGIGSGSYGGASSSAANAGLDGKLLPARYATISELLEDSDEFVEVGGAATALRGFASSALLGFASTACVMPFEVGKTLMQIQWIPKADVELLNEYDEDDEEAEVLLLDGTTTTPSGTRRQEQVIYDVDDLSDEEDAQAYFHDLQNNSRQRGDADGSYFSARQPRDATGGDGRRRPTRNRTSTEGGLRAPGMTPSVSLTPAAVDSGDRRDAAGYITRRTIFEAATKPEWILPFTVTGGVWDMMKAIGRWKGEGWLSLWKGQLTTFALESLSSFIQPTIYSLLASLLLRDVPFSSLPLVHMPSPMKPLLVTVVSHVLTSYAVSPLDLVKTRLIAQSAQTRHRKYSGPLNALRTISDEEGGISGMYTHSNLVFPALLEGAVRSLFQLSIPLLIERKLSVLPTTNSFIYGIADFSLSTFSLLFTLPIETVRRRLQVQSRAVVVGGKSGRSFKTCVETRPENYVGIVESIYRILTEETGRLHLHNVEQKPRRPSMSRRNTSASNAGAAPGMSSRRSSYRAGAAQDEAAQAQREWSSHHHPNATRAAATSTEGPDGEIVEGGGEQQQAPSTPSMPLLAGVSQLYRGFSMGVGANLIILILGLVAGRDDTNSGWTEM